MVINRLQVWHVESIIRQLSIEELSSVPSINNHFTASLSDSWSPPATPCSLIDAVVSLSPPLSLSLTPSLSLSLSFPFHYYYYNYYSFSSTPMLMALLPPTLLVHYF